jgi:hypothetical protein
MFFKTFIVIALCAILLSLGSGLFFMIRDKGRSDRTLKALTLRIALSISLFLILMIAYATGLISPHGVQPLPSP